MWLFETLFMRVLSVLGKILTSIGFIGMLVVGNFPDYKETVMDVFVGVIASGVICFGAMALAMTINQLFFKELN